MTVKTKEYSIRFSDVFWMNTRASLSATVSHHTMHYSIIFWIRGSSCTLCFQRISEKEYSLNDHFINIGYNLARTIDTGSNSFKDYLHDIN